MSLIKRLQEVKEVKNTKYYPYKEYDLIIDKFPMRQADRIKFKKLVRDNKDFRQALKRELTEQFKEDFDYAMKNEQNFIYAIIGKLGRGKSTLALILSIMARFTHQLSEILFAYSFQEANDSVKDLPIHSTLTLDEPLRISGTGKNTVLGAFYNILQMCREYSKNFIFNIKTYAYVENVDIYLELFGFNKETGETRALWREDKGKYLGYIILKKNFTDEEQEKIKSKKKDKWDNLTENKGLQEAIELDYGKFSEEFIKKEVIENDNNFKSPHMIASFIRTEYKHPNSVAQDLANRVWLEMDKIKRKEKDANKVKALDDKLTPKNLSISDFLLIEEEKNEKMFQKIMDFINLEPEEREVFQSLTEEIPYRKLITLIKSDKFKVISDITTFKKSIQQKQLGYSGEEAYYFLNKDKYKKLEHFGLSSHLPDFVNHDRQWIISFKTIFSKSDISNYVRYISQNEINWSLKFGYNLIYMVYVVLEKKLYTYEYLKIKKNNPVEKLQVDLSQNKNNEEET